ncbi:phosphoenolpyruvate--protein phosphotransferase [Actinomadura flavalba]|uniref:phosphoenolpyruvate--protein phosphotransferase n=1 Tax=Actinomadura flavalba TaxID=1120938 RepID=UPI000378A679|nr:putative PEP-binding protein [Actinomadura flavalba]
MRDTGPLRGTGVSPGVAYGPVRRLSGTVPEPPAGARHDGDGDAETALALAALEAVASRLDALSERAATAEGRDVLAAQSLMARDPGLSDDVAARVALGLAAPRAVYEACGVHRAVFASGGAYLAARVADLDDVRDRAVAELLGVALPGPPEEGEPFVLAARDLAPADAVLLDPARVLALVTAEGGPTSHTAIVARALGVPAVVALPGADELAEGIAVVVDGTAGTLVVDPPDAVVAAARAWSDSRARHVEAAPGPGATADGHRIPLLANIAGPEDLPAAREHGAEGVGLYRTELLFLGREEAPSEEEQAAAYREVLEAFPDGEVVIRLLDGGADKPLPFLPAPAPEGNPALGERGLRMLQHHPTVLATQLRALARACHPAPPSTEEPRQNDPLAKTHDPPHPGTSTVSPVTRLAESQNPSHPARPDAHPEVAVARLAEGGDPSRPARPDAPSEAGAARLVGSRDSSSPAGSGAASGAGVARLGVLAPMVTGAQDAWEFAEACRAVGLVRPGVMVEIPSAALRARDVAAQVEFLSVGTNDLVQYVCAADRQSGALASLQDPWLPAVLDLVLLAARAGVPCGVCGEAAADPDLACVLTGLGVTSLSMAPAALPAVRAALAAHTLAQCRAAADAARAATTATAARKAARKALATPR